MDHFGIALLDALLNPLLEGSSMDGVNHVTQILTRQLLNLLLGDRKSLQSSTVLVVASKVEDFFNRQSLEIGNADVLDIVTFDDATLCGGQVSQMKNGDGMVGREVSLAFRRQEAVNLQSIKSQE